jgi:hypothetical protein
MSDLLNKASLVMIPSGYKEDVVYSAVPSDGSGDLAFSRASNGTRINSAGLVEVCPWNLLSNSEEFTSANGWFASITGGSTASQTSDYGVAPNGTTTADRIQLALNGQPYADWVSFPTVPIVVGQTYTYSIYMKSLSGTPTIYFFYDGVTSFTKTLTTDWVRYQHTFTATNTSIYPRFLLQAGSSSSADILAWGYQLNIGSTAKPYFPTTDRLNVPRLTYQNGGGGCPSLLLEKQSTNFTLYSEQFTNALWVLDGDGPGQSVTANYSISPDGTQNAERLQLNKTGGSYSRIRQNSVQIGVYTFSVYLKSNTSSTQNVGIRLEGAGINCAVTPTWQRFSVTTTTLVNAQSQILLFDSIGGNDETADISIWGAQLEAGAYPTSYIPTTSASATRVADLINTTGKSALIGQTEGVIFADVVTTAGESDYVTILQAFGDYSNRLAIGIQVGTTNIFGYFNASNTVKFFNSSTQSAGRHKIALAYKSGDIALYIDGASTFTSTNTFTFATTLSTIFMNNLGGSAEIGSFKVNEALIFKTRLTNAELASITTI